MSHRVGTVQTAAFSIGPDTGEAATSSNKWAKNFNPTPAPTGTKFVILHFTAASLPANNRIEVDLGYDMDVFTSAHGADFWTRPVNINALGGVIPVRYVTDGATTGSATIDKYGRGERVQSTSPYDPNFQSYTNCDPFLPNLSYTEPDYDGFWFCNTPPEWENVDCIAPAADIRRTVAQSVGMIVAVEGTKVSTCSVTCIGPDLVLTAGHCFENPTADAASSSVIFNYETTCGGSKPSGYAGKFFKVKRIVKYVFDATGDWCILQLDAPSGGIGVPERKMRPSLPSVGDSVFGIHHPNGAVKKLSPLHPAFAAVASSNASGIVTDIDVSGGSSGSSLFDDAGWILGVLSNGPACNLSYFPTPSILSAIASAPGGPTARRVMIVFDRSGSMSEPTQTGQTKIVEAREAASLFVQLIREGGGNRLGLVSFSTAPTTPPEHALGPVNAGSKATLIGPTYPYSGGVVGSLTPGGWTSIGGGLEVARDELSAPSTDPATILLLTDGMQNTPPMIETVEPSLGGIAINAIGFGTESNLNGALLTELCQNHDGLYVRAGTGLELKKYFALAFGDIFESGTLLDPEDVLRASDQASKPVAVKVCGEEAITVVVGWEDPKAALAVRVLTPSGATVTMASPGVESSTGRTWTFLRIPLPQGGDRDGTWQAIVSRQSVAGKPAERPADVKFFVTVLAMGGATLKRYPVPTKQHYTGDVLNPLVILRRSDGTMFHDASVRVTITRPRESVGSLLARRGLRRVPPSADDALPARLAALRAVEEETQQPATEYVQDTFDLIDDPTHNIGTFEKSGIFGNPLSDLLKVEGNYTIHAVATYGEPGCEGTRETTWTLHVGTGIDPDRSEVRTALLDPRPDGRRNVLITLVPRDKYGNHYGPSRVGDLKVTGTPGTLIERPPKDKGDGAYEIRAAWDPASGHPPGVVVHQPGRDPAVICDSRGSAGGRQRQPRWMLVLIVVLAVLVLVLLGLLLAT